VNVEINAVLIMQTLFGFELGNYYRLVFPFFTFSMQSELMDQGCFGSICIHCWAWHFASSGSRVFLEGEAVVRNHLIRIVLYVKSSFLACIHVYVIEYVYL
jgi:hypothetical protein